MASASRHPLPPRRCRRGAAQVEGIGLAVVVAALALGLVAAASGAAGTAAATVRTTICALVAAECPGGAGVVVAAADPAASGRAAATVVRPAAAERAGWSAHLDAAGDAASPAELERRRSELAARVAAHPPDAFPTRGGALAGEARALTAELLARPEGDAGRLDATGRPVDRDGRALERLVDLGEEYARLRDADAAIGAEARRLAADATPRGASGSDDAEAVVDPCGRLGGGVPAGAVAEYACRVDEAYRGYRAARLPYDEVATVVVRDAFLEAQRLDRIAREAKEAGKEAGRAAAEASTPDAAAAQLRAGVAVQHRLEAFKNAAWARTDRLDRIEALGGHYTGDRPPGSDRPVAGTPFTIDDFHDQRAEAERLLPRQTGYTAEVAREVRTAKRAAQERWPDRDWGWVPGNLGEPGG